MLSCQELKVYYPIRRGILNRIAGYVRAVDGVSLEVPAGETLGIVGESGCGKTTLGRTLAGLEKPTAGTVSFNGKDLTTLKGAEKRLARQNIQMIFQDPFSSLDPRMCAADIITEGAEANRIKPPEGNYRDFAARLMREVGLEPESMFRHPHEFSGGQRQRLSIARALALNPSCIICDEPVSALDVSVQAQVIKLLIELRERHRLSYIFISHDLSVVRLMANRVAVMYLGHIVETGSAEEVLTEPQHPYTRALVSAIPVPGKSRTTERIILSGEPPSPANPPTGCPFRTRCPLARPECAAALPELQPMPNSPGHLTACNIAR